MSTVRVDADAILRLKSLGRFTLSSIKLILTCYLIAYAAVLPVQAQTNTFAATNLAQSWSGNQTFNGIVDASGSTATRPIRVVTLATIPVTCTALKDLIIVSDAAQSARIRECNASGNGFDVIGGTAIPNAFVVDGSTYVNLAAAFTAAGSTGVVIIPPNYAGSDTNANSNGIQVIDLRGKPNRMRGFINVLTDCGLKGTGLSTDDDGPAINACFNLYPGYGFLFPQTVTHGCSYWSNQTLVPKGTGYRLLGGSGSNYLDGLAGAGHLGGVEICFGAGVTGFLHDANNASSGAVSYLTFKGAAGITSLQSPTGLNVPSALPQFTRSITSIQRDGASNLTFTIAAAGTTEGLTQQVGSTVLISGVVGDTTMNGRCVVTSLAAGGGSTTNPRTATCTQNGAASGPFANDGTVSLPSTGTGNADGIRVCGNFLTLDHVGTVEFERHGINADSTASNGCALPFSDDLVLRDSIAIENGGNGFYCKGGDCNAGYMAGNQFYYNFLRGVEDQSSLGNTWVGNNISNNGHLWATATTPATHAISTISRTLSGGVSTTTVVLSSADLNLKQGSCIVIAGVTDTTFNTATPPAGTATQCFQITSFTDSTHFQYEQPGAPANASSSGGTERMGKFSEVYVSVGVDDGAVKFGTQGSVWSSALFSNYIEGGQDCKYGATILNIGGANSLACLTTQDWIGAFISTNGSNAGKATNVTNFTNEFDGNMTVGYRSGKTTDFNITTQWRTHLNATGWSTIVTPGAAGYSFQFFDNTSARRNYFDAAVTRIDSIGSGAVEINKNGGQNSGTAGLEVWSGGVTPAAYAKLNSSGLTIGTFNSIDASNNHLGASFKSSTANPAATGVVRLAKTDAINFRNNANSADISGVSLDSSDRVLIGGAAGIIVSSIPSPGPIGGLISSSAIFTTVVANVSVTSPTFISSTANPASAGVVRLAKTDIINARNNANNADIPLLQLNASDQAVCGNANGCTDINGNKFGTIIASGTSALGTGAITATTCATVVTTSATNTATTDSIEWSFNAAPGTGYTSGLHVLPYPTANNVNFLVCNPTAGPLTPAAATLNWRVIR